MASAVVAATLIAAACGTSNQRQEVREAARGSASATASTGDRPATPKGWLKGQLHLHSDASGDSHTPAAAVVRWYSQRAYDFIVFTDHNRVTEAASTSEMLVLPGVELTQNLPHCLPAPASTNQCLLHVNALIVDPAKVDRAASIRVPDSEARVERYAFAMAQAEAMDAVAQLNHPNFHYAASPAQVAALARRGLVLLEIANEAWDSNNDGDASHPSTIELWDQVLTGGGRVFGTATDDAHHYEDAESRRAAGEPVFVGDLGFVMVRAEREPVAIRNALRRGEFYASTGVLLEKISFVDETLEVSVASGTPAPHTITIVADGGAVVQASSLPSIRFETRGTEHTYVRAVVTDRDGRHAWVQPVFLGR